MKDSVTILLADDDEEDRMLTRDALKESKVPNELRTVSDGEELLDYLLRRGRYTNPESSPRPALILLDLNMPKKDGREAIKEIKEHAEIRQIPIVVLTTSKADEDIFKTYQLGVSSYITKPVSFTALVDVMKTLGTYWFGIVELPRGDKHS